MSRSGDASSVHARRPSKGSCAFSSPGRHRPPSLSAGRRRSACGSTCAGASSSSGRSRQRTATPPRPMSRAPRRAGVHHAPRRHLIGLGRFEKDMLALLAARARLPGSGRLCSPRCPRTSGIGIGGAGEGASSLRRTPSRAQRAVDDQARLVRPSERVHRYADLAPRRRQRRSSTAEGMPRRVLGAPRTPGTGATYRGTLDAFLRHGMRQVAAAALGIHPHTLSYRLNRLRERFGIGPRATRSACAWSSRSSSSAPPTESPRPEPPARQ